MLNLGEAKEPMHIQLPSDFEAAGEGWFQEQYGRYGRMSHKLPVDAWYVGNNGVPQRVKVIKLRGGGADYYESGSDYADFDGGRQGLTVRVFPMKGFTKPVQYKIKDQYGWVGRWFAFRRGKKPKPAANESTMSDLEIYLEGLRGNLSESERPPLWVYRLVELKHLLAMPRTEVNLRNLRRFIKVYVWMKSMFPEALEILKVDVEAMVQAGGSRNYVRDPARDKALKALEQKVERTINNWQSVKPPKQREIDYGERRSVRKSKPVPKTPLLPPGFEGFE